MAADSTGSSKGLANLIPFKPGQSGNPGGKNPERERLRKAVLEFGAEAIAIAVDIARNGEQEKNRLAAALKLLEWCIGKPDQMLTGPDGGPIQLDGEIRGRLLSFLSGTSGS